MTITDLRKREDGGGFISVRGDADEVEEKLNDLLDENSGGVAIESMAIAPDGDVVVIAYVEV